MSNFPSDPALGAIYQLGRKVWTFNGEGWEQGRRVLTSPPEDPGSALVPPEPTDPLWSYVQLLLKMDNVGGPTTFIDVSSSPKTISQGNSSPNLVQQISSDFKFGPGCADFSAANDWLLVSGAAVFDVGSSEFTMECWVKFTYSGTAPWGIYAKRSGSTFVYFDSLSFYVTGDGAIGALAGPLLPPSFWQVQMLTGAGVVPNNTWTHIAYQRSGDRFSIFVAGNEVANQTYTGAVNSTSGVQVSLGAAAADGTLPYPGLMDEFRFTIGATRYSWPTYTVPIAPFPTS